jgi:hypothetical protein
MNTLGFFVKVNSGKLENEKEERVNALLNELKDLGFVDLPGMRNLHHATEGEFRRVTKKISEVDRSERRRNWRREYLKKPEVIERMKEYRNKPEVKQRKKYVQSRRSGAIKKLRALNPVLYNQLMWQDDPRKDEITVDEQIKEQE